MDAGNGREIPRYALPCHPARGRRLFFPRQADGEDAVFVYPLMDFVETGAGDELVHSCWLRRRITQSGLPAL